MPYSKRTPLELLHLAVLFSAVMTLVACLPAEMSTRRETVIGALHDCGTDGAGAGCVFRNAPVRLQPVAVDLPGRPYRFFPTAAALTFVDGAGREWLAPKATLTDGASIPPVFVSVVGDPTAPEFATAATLHDAYCGIGNEAGAVYHSLPWQDVHRMFYDSLVVSGTPVRKAQLMFSAVWLGGPRWNPVSRRDDSRMDRMPDNLQKDILIETASFIDREKPDMATLVSYLEWQEKKLEWRSNGGRNWKRPTPP